MHARTVFPRILLRISLVLHRGHLGLVESAISSISAHHQHFLIFCMCNKPIGAGHIHTHSQQQPEARCTFLESRRGSPLTDSPSLSSSSWVGTPSYNGCVARRSQWVQVGTCTPVRLPAPPVTSGGVFAFPPTHACCEQRITSACHQQAHQLACVQRQGPGSMIGAGGACASAFIK